MKYFPLVLSNLKRHKLRTTLTILSVALALFLFASLRTVVTQLEISSQLGAANRMIVQNATAFVFPLPQSYAARLSAVPHVTGVTWANWFGGKYGDGKKFFGPFAVDPATYLDMYKNDFIVPEDQKAAFLRERTAVIVGQGLLKAFGWKIGDNVTIQGTIFPGDWTFTIRGTYTLKDPAYGEEQFLFHYDYLYERVKDSISPGWFILRIDDPSQAGVVAKTIDDQFRNSPAPTKTGTEQSFSAGFMTMFGNIQLLMGTIGMAVVFAILLIAANAMLMNQRERTSEVAVLKTVGFTDQHDLHAGDRRGGGHRALGGGDRDRAGDHHPARDPLQRLRLPPRLPRHQRHDDGRGGHRVAAVGRQRLRTGVPGGEDARRAGAQEGRVKIPLIYNVRSVIQRPVSTAFTALGIGLVVAVFIAMLALANGFAAALTKTGGDDNILVMRKGADSEMSSGIARADVNIIGSFPHVALGSDGKPLVSPETYIVMNLPRRGADSLGLANVVIRGVSPRAFEVRKNITLEGRPFATGQSEVCVGDKIVPRYKNTAIGETLRFAGRDWKVVCHFSAAGSSFESEVWGEAEQFQSAMRGGNTYQSVTFRLKDPAGFAEAKRALEGDQRLQVDAHMESKYYADQSKLLGRDAQLSRHHDHQHHVGRGDLRRGEHHVRVDRLTPARDRGAPHARLQAAQRAPVVPRRVGSDRLHRRDIGMPHRAPDQRRGDEHDELVELQRDRLRLPRDAAVAAGGDRVRGGDGGARGLLPRALGEPDAGGAGVALGGWTLGRATAQLPAATSEIDTTCVFDVTQPHLGAATPSTSTVLCSVT